MTPAEIDALTDAQIDALMGGAFGITARLNFRVGYRAGIAAGMERAAKVCEDPRLRQPIDPQACFDCAAAIRSAAKGAGDA